MSYDPHSKEWLLNRFEIYKELRARDTAYWSDEYQVHVITRYDDVFYVLNNPKIFSSAGGNLLIETGDKHGRKLGYRLGNTLGASDNPTHNDYKNIVIDAYHKDNIDRVAELMTEKALPLLENKTEINISEVTEALAAWVSTEILNSPIDKDTAQELTLNTHRHHPLSSLEHAVMNYDQYLMPLISRAKMKMPSGPGVYNEYINNNPKNIECPALIVGPMMTGPGSLGGALQYLTIDLYYQNQLDKVLQDRSLIPKAVNESLRFRAAVGRFTRTVTENVRLHGIDLKPGDRIAIALESANRDEAKWYKPDEFIIDREDNVKHLSWGYGVHICIAMAISKEMMRLYLKLLLDKIGKYEITTKPEELDYILMWGCNISIMSNIMLRKI